MNKFKEMEELECDELEHKHNRLGSHGHFNHERREHYAEEISGNMHEKAHHNLKNRNIRI